MAQPEGKIQVLLFGLGAIGGFYAFILGKNPNVSLSVCARSNYEAVKENGLQIESENHGSHKVDIDHVFKSPSDAPSKFDYIVCAHKAVKTSTIPPLFKSVTTDSTVFAIMQNGVGNEDPFRAFYPSNTIISCVVWVGAVQKTPGIINHWKAEDTQMGLFSNPSADPSLEKQKLEQFTEFFRIGKSPFSVEENIQINRWEKCVWNAAWNPLTTLTQVQVQPYLKSTPQAMASTKQLMREMISVARKCGVPLEEGLADSLVEKVLAMQPIFSSMYVDMKEGRPMEVEVILGTPMKRAVEFGMEDEVPVLRTIFALVTAIDQRLSGA